METKLVQGNKDFAQYLSRFPPIDIWRQIKPNLSPETAETLESVYLWGARYLDNFLTGKTDPLLNSGLSEELQAYIESKATFWLLQGNLLFQAEKYLRAELENQGMPCPWNSWVDLNKRLVFEEFYAVVFTEGEVFWESLPIRTLEESRRDAIKFLDDAIAEKSFNRSCNKWEKDKSKLKNSFDDIKIYNELMPWTRFCYQVCEKYKRKLPGFLPWASFRYEDERLPPVKKSAIINGQLVKYPGRGQGKVKKKIS